jgi:hypothetical protein
MPAAAVQPSDRENSFARGQSMNWGLLLGQSMNMNWESIVNHPEFTVPLGMMALGAIAIVGVVILKVVKIMVTYRERIYRIEHGLDPEIPPDTYTTRRRVG